MGAPSNLLYVGTYTRHGRSEGIHVFAHDPDTGRLTHRSEVIEQDPSFLAFDPERKFLFACSEGLTTNTGAVASFSIDPRTGALAHLSRRSTRGGEPCHLCTDPTGSFLIVANHENGSVAVLPINSDGRLEDISDFHQHTGSGPGPTQKGPRAHHVTFDPAGQRVLVTDKGIDQVVIYRLDSASGKLVPNDPPFGRIHAGAAPRHLAFGHDGQFAYVNGEADMTLAACSYDASSGTLTELHSVSTLPAGAGNSGWSTAELAVAPSGNTAYVSNRGHDSIAIFSIDSSTGRVTPVGHASTGGRTPRNFAIDPTGRRLYAANQESDTIVHFDIDQRTGQLTPNGDVTSVGAPVCLLFS
ncbi:MAG: lactonase family protein [Chloroflexi bacterium]|nr:lactonase family protein [Chloroflexota bacterium]